MRREGRVDAANAVRMAITAACVLCMVFAGTAAASSESSSSSPNYIITEAQFGAGAATNDCSENYCANMSVGDTAAGLMESKSYIARAGGTTTDEPLLEVAASGGFANLGTLDPGRTAALTMTVSVRNYLTGGYVMQIAGSPPGYESYQIPRLEEPTFSTPGVEQFGINLVANNSPAIGADPVQVPSGDISFGRVTESYAIPDKFMYKDGDVVAFSETDSGRTDYTISMILNISNATPKGGYTSIFSAVVAPSY
ncbi:hypothetical protein IRY61_02010 [Candidatus Saccharibacteria bacterium]|nr:hypothetical protein [Candidatus Saccharibacteria bacterium]